MDSEKRNKSFGSINDAIYFDIMRMLACWGVDTVEEKFLKVSTKVDKLN